jgi:hypothetical protein
VIPPARIDLAAKLYLLGRSPRSIQHRLAREFGVDARTARRYLARAKKQLGAKRPVDPAAGAARAEALQLEAFALARTQADPRAMSLIAHRLAELDGALVQRLVHSGEVHTTGTVTLKWPDDPGDDPHHGGAPGAAPAPG